MERTETVTDCNKPYEELANAIIIQAAKDYCSARGKGERSRIMRFFKSEWFVVLTDVDPQLFIEKLNKKIECRR